jgi:hypothetical protein
MLPAWRSICRMLASLLLAVMIATPAIAEIACADDELTHVTSAATGEVSAGSALPPDGNDPASPEQAGHCAFNHGHCNALAATSADGAMVQGTESVFADLVPHRPACATPSGPDRPPRS